MKYIATIAEKEYEIEILSETRVLIDDVPHEIDFKRLRQYLSFSLLVDGKSYETNIYQDNNDWEVLLRGRQFTVDVEDERDRRLRLAAGHISVHKGKLVLRAPMPGLVIDIPVAEGDQVTKGDVLVILESMKMQNELTAPRDGKVTRIQAKVNDNVERKESLLVLE
jgi:acetyl/propionyl-CoA carboxylase alpha subunit